MSQPLVLVHGAGDIGSAVALLLLRAGARPVLLEGPAPLTTRRRMAFSDAVFDGECRLEEARAVRADRLGAGAAGSDPVIPLHVAGVVDLPDGFRPDVWVDARMRKRERARGRIADAPLVIGLGPGFAAPADCDLVIETAHGPQLGAIIDQGEAAAYDGVPQEIGGTRRERQLRATVAGEFRATAAIGERVRKGQTLGEAGGQRYASPFDGIVRGLLRDGVQVREGARLAEVVPGESVGVAGLGGRPRAIGVGVVDALRARGLLAS